MWSFNYLGTMSLVVHKEGDEEMDMDMNMTKAKMIGAYCAANIRCLALTGPG